MDEEFEETGTDNRTEGENRMTRAKKEKEQGKIDIQEEQLDDGNMTFLITCRHDLNKLHSRKYNILTECYNFLDIF